MKYYRSSISKLLPIALSMVGLIATNARATIYYWDNNGLSAPTSGTWDTTTAQWATSNTPTDTPVPWPNPAVAAGFPVGTSPLSSLNIEVDSSIDIAGIFNGLSSSVGVTNLVINGTGSLNIVDGQQGFWTGNSKFNTILQLPLTGTGGLQNQSSGSLYLSGQNTFSGGIWTATPAGLNFNSGNALGTGIITNTSSPSVLATPAKDSAGNNFATSAITITNSYYTYGGGNGTLIYVGIAAAPTTFTGPMVLENPAGNTETFQNQPGGTLVTISGPISGAANFTKTGAGKLVLTGDNTYTGQTTINNGILSVVSYNSVVNGAAASSLGAPTDVASGTINIGATTANMTNIYTGPGETSDRVINLSGTTGTVTLQADGTGPLVFTSDFTASGAGAKKLTLQGSNTGNNSVKGAIVDSTGGATSVTKSGAGTWELAGNNTYSGGTIVTAGQLNIGSATALSTGSFTNNGSTGKFDNTSGADLTIPNTALAQTGGFHYVGSANNVTLSNPVLSGNGAARNAIVDGHTLTFNALSQDTAGNGFAKGGIGTLRLVGTASYTGATSISSNGGTLEVDGDISSSSGVTVNGGVLQGVGTIPSVTLNASGAIAPGNGVGTITTGNETWNGGAHYAWQINDANGTAGTDPGYDTIAINGTLTLAATSANQFSIDVQSLSGSTPGDAANLGTSGTWTLATATGGITGFDSSAFSVNTNNLSNSIGNNVFVVSLSADGKSLLLNLLIPAQQPENYTATGAGTGSFTGSPNRSYTIQYTDSLSPINWQTLTVVTTDGAGVGSYSDPGPLPSQRFYRISAQ